MMHPKFADRMSDLGEITDETLERRWETLTTVVDSATAHQRARLVLIACGADLVRDTDTWFWEPFRAHELTIPVDDGAELFMRFAECAARHMIEEDRYILPAMFVRLAENAGLSPFHQDLVDAAVDLLCEQAPEPPAFSAPNTFWPAAAKKALEENPNDPSIVAAQLATIAAGAQRAVQAMAQQFVAFGKWGVEVGDRFDKEQKIVHWLLNGVRADGLAWSELDAATVAISAASELAELVVQAPQLRHEATLTQVLGVAGKESESVFGTALAMQSMFSAPDDEALASLVPLTVALAAGKPLPEISANELAVRILWEATTLQVWDKE